MEVIDVFEVAFFVDEDGVFAAGHVRGALLGAEVYDAGIISWLWRFRR